MTVAFDLVVMLACRLRKRQRRYGIRTIILLTLAASIPASMHAYQNTNEKRRQRAVIQLKETESRILGGPPHRQLRSGKSAITLQEADTSVVVSAINFAIEEDIGCGCCYDTVCSSVSNDDLAALEWTPGLEHLNLADASITDEGLKYISRIRKLKSLNLTGNAITDDGMAHLSGRTELRKLVLDRTRLSDAGLLHLCQLESLEELSLNGTLITDSAFPLLNKLTNLKVIRFENTRIEGYGLPHLIPCTKLQTIGDGPISADTMNVFNQFPNLDSIHANVLLPSDATSIKVQSLNKLSRVWFSIGQPVELLQLTDLPALTSFGASLHPCPHRSSGNQGNSSLSCDLCVHHVRAVRLSNLPQLESVFLADVERFRFTNLPRLRSLTLRGVDKVATFRLVGKTPHLRSLSITAKHFTDPVAFQALGPLPALESLRIEGAGLNDASLAMLNGFPNLKSLRLPAGDFSRCGLQHLSSLSRLEELSIGSVRDAGAPLECLSGLSQLVAIEIESGEVGELRVAGFPRLERIELNANCEQLILADLPKVARLRFHDQHWIRELSVTSLPALESLVVYANEHQPLEQVELRRLPRLTELRIPSAAPNRHLTDRCFEHLQSFRQLENVNLDNTRITSATLEQLATLPKLKYVQLYNAPVSESEVAALKSASPSENLRITWAITSSSGLDATGNFKEPISADD